MKMDDLRKQVLLWCMLHRFEAITDRLLNTGVELPELSQHYYITVNSVPVCVVEHALVGQSAPNSACEYSALSACIAYRNQLKAAFPGAVVAVIAGSCPKDCTFPGSRRPREIQAAFDDWSSFAQL